MAIYMSPGVYTQELDISEIIPNIATTTAAIVGYSRKGSTSAPVLITNTQQFINEFGQPNPEDGFFHYSALAYLSKGNQLYALRVVNGALFGGASISESGNSNSSFVTGYTNNVFSADSNYPNALFYIFGKDKGTWNNKISIKITDVDAVEKTFVIEVYYQDSDGNYNIVESFTVSRQSKVDGYGRQLYLETVINGFSDYITVSNNTVTADTVLPQEQTTLLSLAEGTNGSTVTASDISTGWDAFSNPENIDIRLLINGGNTDVVVQSKMKSIAESRKDCIAILDMPYDQLTSVVSMINWRQSTQNFNSSYTALYTAWLKINDAYNDKIVNVPPSGYVAGMMAYTDYSSETWFAPAGFERGILDVLGVTNTFTQGERDQLYAVGINVIQRFVGEGVVIWGQKTQQVKASALDRINVRRLLIVLEKSISIALRAYCFSPNSSFTRTRISSTVDEFLNLLSARGAFQTETGDKGYRVVCDTTNNTPAVIDRNELHVDVFIKPIRMAEFIQLRTIVTASGTSFEELIARGVLY